MTRVGSALTDMCMEGKFIAIPRFGEWYVKLQIGLNAAYLHFKNHCRDMHLLHTHRGFRVCGLSLKTWSRDFPELKGKAHNSVVVLRWRSFVVLEMRDGSGGDDLRAMTLWA